MRAPVSASSWLKRTSCDVVAETSRTGTVTSPKLIDPVQMALGTSMLPRSWPLLLPSQVVAPGPRVPRGAAPAHRGRRRRPAAAPHQSRQGALPRDGLHQRSGRRLLRPDRAGDAPPPRGPPGHHAAPPRRGRGRAVLREALPGPPARVAANGAARRRLRHRRLLDRRACPAWCGRPTSRRWSCTPRRPGPTIRGTPPRSCSTSIPAPAPTSSTARASPSSSTSCWTSSACARSPRRRARRDCTSRSGIRPSVDAETTKAFAQALGQVLESRDPKRVTVNMAQGAAARAGVRRLEPERPAQDHRVRVFAAGHARARRVDPGVVGRAHEHGRLRRGAGVGVRSARRARSGSRSIGDLYAASLAGDQDLPELG